MGSLCSCIEKDDIYIPPQTYEDWRQDCRAYEYANRLGRKSHEAPEDTNGLYNVYLR